MGSRAKWEDMVNTVKDMFPTDKKPQEKAEVAAKNLGSGGAAQAANAIMNHKKQLEQQMKDAGI
jgi:exopolyphosphatase/pppGpp-phosphohydrolase